MIEYFVRIIPLPRHVEACVTPNDDGTFSIYVNALLPESARERAIRHEIEHIKRDHFYTTDSVLNIEKQASA